MPRLVIIIICVALSLLIIFFLVYPQYQEFKSVRAQIDGKNTELQYLEEYFSKLNQASEKLKEYDSQLSKIDTALPTDAPLVLLSLVDFVRETSYQNGLIFQNLISTSISAPKVSGQAATDTDAGLPSNIKEISMSFRASGSYFALKNFLNALENNAKIIEIETISFSSEEEELPTFNIKITTYCY
jgi:Tfp pilus assembly protein PilO